MPFECFLSILYNWTVVNPNKYPSLLSQLSFVFLTFPDPSFHMINPDILICISNKWGFFPSIFALSILLCNHLICLLHLLLIMILYTSLFDHWFEMNQVASVDMKKMSHWSMKMRTSSAMSRWDEMIEFSFSNVFYIWSCSFGKWMMKHFLRHETNVLNN